MSWDVVIMAATAPPPPAGERQAQTVPLGSNDEVRAWLRDVVPGSDWSDPQWGILRETGFTVDFNLGDEDPVDSLLLHFQGGTHAHVFLQDFLKASGWYAMDMSSGEWFHHLPDPAYGHVWSETFHRAQPIGRGHNYMDRFWRRLELWVTDKLGR